MSAPMPLTAALSSLEAEIWSTTPFAVAGLLSPAGGDKVRIELHSPGVLAVNALPSAAFEPGGAVDQLRSIWATGTVTRVPIDANGTELFAARAAGASEADDVAVLTRLAERIAAMAADAEPAAERERRLTRINALADVLRAMSTALDIRDVFDQLSSICQRVLPHDSALALEFTDGEGRYNIRLHAISVPQGWTLPETIENPYPAIMTDGWDFSVHYDFAIDPVERELAGARAGLRSAIRLPIRIDGKVIGALIFSANQPRQYVLADVPIARRVADYVTLALSHQRLANNARDAAAVHARAANLEMLDGLLRTLAGALDVRDVFDRVSRVSEKAIAHDAMAISMPTPDGQGWTLHVTTGALAGLPTPFVMRAPTPRLLDSHWDFELVADMRAHAKYEGTPSVNAGLRCLLSLPVWLGQRLRATVNFYSHTPGHFTTDDVLVGRRIADHITLALSHQQLADEARTTVDLRAKAANIELLDELLTTIADTGELKELFERISAVAGKVLPHDAMMMPVLLADGKHAHMYASAGVDSARLPEEFVVPDALHDPAWEYHLIDDLTQRPEDYHARPAALGFRSTLRMPIRLEGRFAAGLAFFSRQPGAFKEADVLVARRIADRLAISLQRERGAAASKRADEAAARAAKLEARVRALTDELDARTGYRRVVGESASWRQVLTQAAQVAATDTTVLLLGESGTGKEVIARFLHRATFLHGRPGPPERRDAPFVALNCAALPEQLLEAELFGYERGAFTGATQSKPGQLEQASGGTLFLDEVGEMSPSAQAKFLRVLQEREFQRLGGTRVLKTDARIIAATNRDLPRAIAQGTFREDLFYRLNVFAIRLPPLRDRRDDILPLSDAFLTEIGRGLGRPPSGIAKDARARLTEYHWPGNVRELRNILERAAILCDGGLITSDHLALHPGASTWHPGASASHPGASESHPGASASHPGASASHPGASTPHPGASDLSSMERSMIEQALRKARFNKSKAAQELGLTRAQLYVRMRKHGLE